MTTCSAVQRFNRLLNTIILSQHLIILQKKYTHVEIDGMVGDARLADGLRE